MFNFRDTMSSSPHVDSRLGGLALQNHISGVEESSPPATKLPILPVATSSMESTRNIGAQNPQIIAAEATIPRNRHRIRAKTRH